MVLLCGWEPEAGGEGPGARCSQSQVLHGPAVLGLGSGLPWAKQARRWGSPGDRGLWKKQSRHLNLFFWPVVSQEPTGNVTYFVGVPVLQRGGKPWRELRPCEASSRREGIPAFLGGTEKSPVCRVPPTWGRDGGILNLGSVSVRDCWRGVFSPLPWSSRLRQGPGSGPTT